MDAIEPELLQLVPPPFATLAPAPPLRMSGMTGKAEGRAVAQANARASEQANSHVMKPPCTIEHALTNKSKARSRKASSQMTGCA